jgi:hypothetical protein
MQGLDTSFTTYRTELGSTATLLREAGDGARMLEQTAEDWLAATRA